MKDEEIRNEVEKLAKKIILDNLNYYAKFNLKYLPDWNKSHLKNKARMATKKRDATKAIALLKKLL